MIRPSVAAVLIGLLLTGATACTAGHSAVGSPSGGRTSSAGASTPSTAVAVPIDPVTYEKGTPGTTLLVDTAGTGPTRLHLNGVSGSGKFVVAVTCTGSSDALTVQESNGGMLERISACSTNGTVIYSSQGAIRTTEAQLTIAAAASTRWRLSAWRITG